MSGWAALAFAVAAHACMAVAAGSSECNESVTHDVSAAFSPSANSVTQPWSVVLGGQGNTVLHSHSAVVAGSGNLVLGPFSAIVGGTGNIAAGLSAVVMASNGSRAVGASAAVLAGDGSAADGAGTLAVGPNAAAVHESSGVFNFYRKKQTQQRMAAPLCQSAGEGTLSICVGDTTTTTGGEDSNDGGGSGDNDGGDSSTAPPIRSGSSGSSSQAAAAALASVFINNVSLGDLVAQVVADAVNVRACVLCVRAPRRKTCSRCHVACFVVRVLALALLAHDAHACTRRRDGDDVPVCDRQQCQDCGLTWHSWRLRCS
jgi:hypothetical protein